MCRRLFCGELAAGDPDGGGEELGLFEDFAEGVAGGCVEEDEVGGVVGGDGAEVGCGDGASGAGGGQLPEGLGVDVGGDVVEEAEVVDEVEIGG